MECLLLESTDPRWEDVLARAPHEFYQTPGYTRLEAGRMGGVPAALWAEEKRQAWLLPLVLRPVPLLPGIAEQVASWRDAVSPYGYPHPVMTATGAESEAFLDRVLGQVRECLRRERILTVFVRCSPLQPLGGAYARCGRVVEHGPCYWLDLTELAEALQSQLRSRYRSYLNAL